MTFRKTHVAQKRAVNVWNCLRPHRKTAAEVLSGRKPNILPADEAAGGMARWDFGGDCDFFPRWTDYAIVPDNRGWVAASTPRASDSDAAGLRVCGADRLGINLAACVAALVIESAGEGWDTLWFGAGVVLFLSPSSVAAQRLLMTDSQMEPILLG